MALSAPARRCAAPEQELRNEHPFHCSVRAVRHLLGQYAYKGFAYNLGRPVLWPTIVIPVLGQILGAIVLVGVLIFILSRRG